MAKVLNSASTSAGSSARRKPNELSLEMQQTMLRIKGDYISADGKGVDYGALRGSELFLQYVQLSSELVDCDVAVLSDEERKAFFLNIYNALTIHGLAVSDQLPRSVLDVSKFWQSTSYNIGGLVFSLDDIEHGVLRGNRPHPSASEPPFSELDPRRRFSLEACDPRVHFALVCGAKSCPAIQVYSARNLERGLTEAAKSFCAQEVHVDCDQKKVTLSKIFIWYARDFGDSETELLRWLCQYLPEKERCDLQLLLSNQNEPIEVEAKDYNWMLNKL